MNKPLPATERLRKIYTLYHETLDSDHYACKATCSTCCTANVTLTRVETDFILKSLGTEKQKALMQRIKQKFPENRFIPKMTTNGFARLCMEGKDIPEEENSPLAGPCPLLENHLCTIYEARPFGCRALISKASCQEQGYASVSPRVLTLNTIFLQTIEHLDQTGITGNLSDMLLSNLLPNPPEHGKKLFIPNEPIAMLMVPPEHQEGLKPLIRRLSYIL